MKNLKILITYFLLEPLGCSLVDPNIAGAGGPGVCHFGASGLASGRRLRRVFRVFSGVDEKLEN
jgi:hypothetical protein